MTGNTTQLTIDLVKVLSSKLSRSPSEASQQEASEALERMGRFVPVISGFALGGAAAAIFILMSETWWSLILPLMAITILAIAAYVQHGRSTAVA
jgi:uncharacterized membrane protein YoaK (UPF0700 family)